MTLQDLTPNILKSIDKPTHLRDFITQLKGKQKFIWGQQKNISWNSKKNNKGFPFHLNHSKFSFL